MCERRLCGRHFSEAPDTAGVSLHGLYWLLDNTGLSPKERELLRPWKVQDPAERRQHRILSEVLTSWHARNGAPECDDCLLARAGEVRGLYEQAVIARDERDQRDTAARAQRERQVQEDLRQLADRISQDARMSETIESSGRRMRAFLVDSHVEFTPPTLTPSLRHLPAGPGG